MQKLRVTNEIVYSRFEPTKQAAEKISADFAVKSWEDWIEGALTRSHRKREKVTRTLLKQGFQALFFFALDYACVFILDKIDWQSLRYVPTYCSRQKYDSSIKI